MEETHHSSIDHEIFSITHTYCNEISPLNKLKKDVRKKKPHKTFKKANFNNYHSELENYSFM